ncbi:MAG TPA: hypothetical protein VFF43_04770 [Caldimonas sp.]|nr:hypothetical protein [Caldimonas sp.]
MKIASVEAAAVRAATATAIEQIVVIEGRVAVDATEAALQSLASRGR